MVSPHSSSITSSIGRTGDKRVDALVGGTKWGGGLGTGADLTYSFAGAGSPWKSGYDSGEPSGLRSLNTTQQSAFQSALAAWSDVANISFTQVTETSNNVGDIRAAASTALGSQAYAWAYYPGGYAEAGDVWLNANSSWTFGSGSYSQMALMNELGHVLGLKHPFEGSARLSGSLDTRQYSIMSYTHYKGADGEPITPMLYDILAIQKIYGANMTIRAGDTVYIFSPQTPLQAIWDAGGSDTFDCSGLRTAVNISLVAGTFSSIGTLANGTLAKQNVAIAFGATIENATGGSGNDTISGNEVANVLNGGAGNDSIAGGAGNDTIDGGVGADRMAGGTGDDTFYVDHSGDSVTESTNQGTDTVYVSASWASSSANVEIFVLTGSAAIDCAGNASANTITGNAAANKLSGLAGNDTLVGGGGDDTLDGGAGTDSLIGGVGNDVYVIDSSSDIIREVAGEGTDTVQASVTTTLAANLENLTLIGSGAIDGTGNQFANVVSGNAGANRLSGLAGNDSLSGGGGADTLNGGAGSDELTGGTGNDRFVFASLGDSPVGSARDIILDFDGLNRLGDVIDLSAIDANTKIGGDQAFTFVGAAAFVAGSSIGKLHVIASGGDSLVQGDVNGDGIADFEILVKNAAAASWLGADFIL